jgi:hypothetical protein
MSKPFVMVVSTKKQHKSVLKCHQGTNDTFVFTNVSGKPILFHPTGTYFLMYIHISDD